MRLKAHQEQFIRAAFDAIGEVVSRQEILNLCEDEGLEYPHWLTSNPKYRHSLRAHYVLPMDRLDDAPATKTKTKKTKTAVVNADPGPGSAPVVASPAAPAPVSSSPATDTTMEFNGGKSLVPDKMKAYVAWGHHDFIGKIVDSGRFYPVYITGLSGNGKTTSVEQVCAEKNREFFRVNINVETDEDDLLGGFRLIDGNTVFQYGPVAEAMRRGAVLLLDEVDLGTTKIMCLQSVLEGKGVYLKKINRWVHPAAGFQVFLTGNTKGQGNGDHDDKFVGTNVLNEAFLDRIPVMLDQDYPPAIIEKKILGKVVKESCGSVDSDAKGFIDNLAKWAEIVRHTFAEGAIEDVITTRRLVQIVQGYCILGDRVESIKNCLTRFDASVQDSFLSLYDKIDADVNTSPTASASDSADSVSTATVPDDAVMALTVSFAERNSVKTHGAEWNPIEKRWFFQRSVWNNLSAETRATITANYSPTWADLDTQTRKMTEIKAYVAQPNPVTV